MLNPLSELPIIINNPPPNIITSEIGIKKILEIDINDLYEMENNETTCDIIRIITYIYIIRGIHMKKVLFLLLASLFFLGACNSTETSNEPKEEKPKEEVKEEPKEETPQKPVDLAV